MNKKLTILLNLFLLLSGVGLLMYTGYRSATLSFTHDESYTYISYVHSSVIDILTYNVNPKIANNHILNTLCMKGFEQLFGSSEFVLRLHSFMAHIVYLLFTCLILRESKSKFLILLGFILLNYNPYLLDFFSLARGYALSISLMVMSLYFFVQYTKRKKQSPMVLALLFGILAVLANFSLISFVVAMIVVLEYVFVSQRLSFKKFLQANIPVCIALLVLLVVYKVPIQVLVDYNQLSFGGNDGLWVDVALSCIQAYIYHAYYDVLLVFLRFLVVFVSLGSIILLYKQLKFRSLNVFSYISMILFFILLFSFLQHLFLQGSYFKERFALFLVPLFFFSFFNVLCFLLEQKTFIKVGVYLLSALTLGCLVTIMYVSINLTHCASWRYDAHTRDMVDVLSKEPKIPGRQTTIGVTSLFEPTINFYRETRKLDWLKPVTRDGPIDKPNYDYYYLFYYLKDEEKPILDSIDKTVLMDYKLSEATLYKTVVLE